MGHQLCEELKSIVVSRQKCRQCYWKFSDMYLLRREEFIVNRTKLLYDASHLEKENLEKVAKSTELQKHYVFMSKPSMTIFIAFQL